MSPHLHNKVDLENPTSLFDQVSLGLYSASNTSQEQNCVEKIEIVPNTDVITDENEPKDITQVLVCFLLHLRQNQLFHDLSNFRAVSLLEKVNEVVPSLCLSC